MEINTIDIKPVTIPQGEPAHKAIVALSGKLILGENAIVVGKNFRELTNMRYGETSPETVPGMTKINSSPGTYLKARSAFHFNKVGETHVMGQFYNTALSASQVLDLIVAPPGTGEFSTALWTDGVGAGYGRFSSAPNESMAYCNGVETCIWGGDEIKIGAFLTSSAAVTTAGCTDPKDYTDIINNTKTDSENCAIIGGGGGNDPYTVLLLHGDGVDTSTTFTDESGTHAPNNNGNVQIDTAQKKFGTGSILFDGTGDFIDIADHANWDFGSGNFTVDFWVRFNYMPAPGVPTVTLPFFEQWVDKDHYMSGGMKVSVGGGYSFYFIVHNNTAPYVIDSNSSWWNTPVVGRWYHIALVRYGNVFTWYVDGVTQYGPDTDASACVDFAASLNIGCWSGDADIGWSAAWFNGHMDEFRISKGIARWTGDFSPPSRPYHDQALTWLIGTTRPVQGFKYYISEFNGSASAMTGSVFNGASFESLTLTDGTDSGPSLGQEGSVTFTSTVGTAKMKFIDGYYLYWYQFSIDVGGAYINRVTADAAFQEIVDYWDGIERTIAACYILTTTYADCTVNVYEDKYSASDPSTYANLSLLGIFADPANCLLLGFLEFPAGVSLSIPSDFVHTTAATTLSVDYWDGTNYKSIGTISDGTSEGGISLAKSGTITWVAPEDAFKRIEAKNTIPLYYVRLTWDVALDATVRIYLITSIPAQSKILGYKFPLHSQDRLMLCCNMNEARNSVRVGSMDTCQVFNGEDSFEVYFGDDNELNCGCTVFAMYGNSLYNMTLFFKDQEQWGLVAYDAGWRRYKISDIGCNAPLTLDTVVVPPLEGQQQVNRSFAIWANANGVYTSDGRHPVDVSYDIKTLFDQNATTHINLSYINSFSGRVNRKTMEYHLFVALTTGTVTTLDAEYVLDLRKWQWYKIDRGTGKKLQCACDVIDAYGNAHMYGFIDSGYCERLENGTDFDGNDIVSTMYTGAFHLAEDVLVETSVACVVPFLATKTITANDATLTHYVNEYDTGTDYTVDPTKANYGLAFPVEIVNSIPGNLHAFKMVMTTNNEVCGLEPYLLGIYYHKVREHDYR